jgi:hypothetical protein
MSDQRKNTQHSMDTVLRVFKDCRSYGGMVIEQKRINSLNLPDSGTPENCYAVVDGRIHCKSDAGEKVYVEYSTVYREEI